MDSSVFMMMYLSSIDKQVLIKSAKFQLCIGFICGYCLKGLYYHAIANFKANQYFVAKLEISSSDQMTQHQFEAPACGALMLILAKTDLLVSGAQLLRRKTQAWIWW